MAETPNGVAEPEAAFQHTPEPVIQERDLEADWTPEATAAVERAEAEAEPELGAGGGVSHAEVMRRTLEMLGR